MHLSAKPPQRLDLPDASPSRPVEDYDLDRREVQARQRAQPTRTNQPCGLIVHSPFQSGNTILVLWLYNEASLALRNTVSPGGHGGEVIPVPIPNTEVKSPSGEGTAGVARGRVARRQAFSPEPRASQSRGALFFGPVRLLTRAPQGACRQDSALARLRAALVCGGVQAGLLAGEAEARRQSPELAAPPRDCGRGSRLRHSPRRSGVLASRPPWRDARAHSCLTSGGHVGKV